MQKELKNRTLTVADLIFVKTQEDGITTFFFMQLQIKRKNGMAAPSKRTHLPIRENAMNELGYDEE